MEKFSETETSGSQCPRELSEQVPIITGLPSGFDDFDKLTGGLQPSHLIIVAGRPSMGKTAFAMNLAQNAAIYAKVPMAVISLEMSSEQLAMRLLSSVSQVDLRSLSTGDLIENDWPKLKRGIGFIVNMPIFVDDRPSFSVSDIGAKCRRLKDEHNIGLVVVDYLQLMRGPSNKCCPQNYGEISRALKDIAKELNIPVIVLSQLNRGLESRKNKRPILFDLPEDIEKDADVICFIYRDEFYNKSPDNPKRGIAELIIAKQRNGQVGTVDLAFLHNTATFKNLLLPEYQQSDK